MKAWVPKVGDIVYRADYNAGPKACLVLSVNNVVSKDPNLLECELLDQNKVVVRFFDISTNEYNIIFKTKGECIAAMGFESK